MRDLMNRFIHFEAVGEPVVDAGGTPEPAAPEPALAAVPEPAPEPATPEWQAPFETLGDQMERLAGGMNELYGMMQPEQPAAEEPAGPEWDPLNPDSVREFIRHEAQALSDKMFEERVGPLEPIIGQVAEQRGEEIARQTFKTIEGEIGKFNHDQALLGTQGLLAAGVEPLQAVEAAARQQFEFEQQLRAQWAEEHGQHIENLRENPDDASGSGTAIEQPAPPQNAHESQQLGAERYERVGHALIERRRPQTAA